MQKTSGVKLVTGTILAATLLCPLSASAQTPAPQAAAQPAPAQQAGQVDHYTPLLLLEHSKSLEVKAATNHGQASDILQKYGVDYTMLAFRNQDGQVELHEKFADIFVIVDGSATLLSGGELANPTTLSPGELHGSAILHPSSTELAKGDVIHIPANTPHQMLIPKGGTVTYFVIKVKEKE
jgi:mannose-6-phosphate isomerase-like protein (cupin superfamily)